MRYVLPAGPKGTKKLRIIIPAVLFAILFSAAALGEEPTANAGVYVGGIDVGGMTGEEVYAAVEGKVQELSQWTAQIMVDGQSVYAEMADFGLAWNNQEIVAEIMELGSSGNILQRYKDQKDIEQSTKEYPLSFCGDVEMIRTFVQGLHEYDTDPVNASIYTSADLLPAVEGGTDGIRVRDEDAVTMIAEAVYNWDGETTLYIDIPTDRVEPEIPYSKLSVICDPLGSATTDYYGSDYGRAVNIENGCSKITDTLLYPGEYFSVTDAVTPFTPENGYEQAPSYEENRVVDSYGGGICQVSTTLYNAVLKAELEVTSRSNHTMAVSYVDLSKDAAIAEGVMDLSFVNTKEEPVYIIGYASGGVLSFTIYGHETRPANRTLELVSVTTSTTEPSAALLYADPAQPVGYISQTQSPHTGYTAELWKNIYIDGELSESVQINSSYYTAVGTIYDIGVASENAMLTQAMYTAISTNDLSQVQTVISQGASYGTSQQTQNQGGTQQTQTDAAGQTSQENNGSDSSSEGMGSMEAVSPEPAPSGYSSEDAGGGSFDIYQEDSTTLMPDVDESAGGYYQDPSLVIMPDVDEPAGY